MVKIANGRFVKPDGEATDDASKGAPCLRVVFHYVPKLDRPPPRGAEAVWALIDTGAQKTFVDGAIIGKSGSPTLGGATISTALGNQTARYHRGMIWVPETKSATVLHVVSHNVASLDSGYKVILGIDFLSEWDLVVSVRDNRIQLVQRA